MTRVAIRLENIAISFPIKIKLYKSLVLSILLYGCESRTLTTCLESRIQGCENKCYRRMLSMQYSALDRPFTAPHSHVVLVPDV